MVHETSLYNRRLAINIIAAALSFIITAGINFFLSPYIVEQVGIDAYGFVLLGNQFVSYLHLFTIALNSMAGRFIAIYIHQKDYEAANKYFSTLFFSNSFISLISIIPISIFISSMNKIIEVPTELLRDVKMLWAFLFCNFLITLVTSYFSSATFSANRLDLSSLREIEGNIIRAILLFLLFFFFVPKIWYLGLAAVVVTIYTSSAHIYYTHKFLPFIKIKKIYFDKSAVIKLVSSGLWNTFNRAGQLLTEGIDLLIANLLIGSDQMGVLALSKTLPQIISSFIGIISQSFAPRFTQEFASGRNDDFVESVRKSMRIVNTFINIPICILAVFGQAFFKLWVPGQDSHQLHMLSLIPCAGLVLTGGIFSVFVIFTVTNKLKFNSVATVVTGILNSIFALILLSTTKLELFAIAGVSTLLSVLKNVFFILPYAALCLKQKPFAFHFEILRSAIAFAASFVFGSLIYKLLPISNWLSLLFSIFIVAFISLIVNIIIIIEIKNLREIISSIFHRKK